MPDGCFIDVRWPSTATITRRGRRLTVVRLATVSAVLVAAHEAKIRPLRDFYSGFSDEGRFSGFLERDQNALVFLMIVSRRRDGIVPTPLIEETAGMREYHFQMFADDGRAAHHDAG